MRAGRRRPRPDAGGGRFAPVPGATLRRAAGRRRSTPNAKQPRQVFDEDALAELTHSIREFGVLQPVVVRGRRRGRRLRAGHGRAPAARRRGGRAGRRSRRSCARPPTTRCCATRCWRTSTAPSSTRWKRPPPTSSCSRSSAPPTTSSPSGSAAAGRRCSNTIRLLNLPLAVQRRVAAGRAVGRATRGRCSASTTPTSRTSWPPASSPRGCRCARPRSWCHSPARRTARQGRPPRAGAAITRPGRRPSWPSKLSDVFDTRVRVDLGRRKGKITVEFASIDDLERIVALMAPQLSRRGLPSRSDSRPIS